MIETNILIVAAGFGTFLLRYIPMRGARKYVLNNSRIGSLQRFLQGVGPAAITALLIASLWPDFSSAQYGRQISALTAVLALIIVKRITGGLVAPIFISAIVYGLVRASLA